MKPFVRFFCRATPNPGGDPYGDLAFEYYEGLLRAEYSVRVFSFPAADLRHSRWEPYASDFIRPFPDQAGLSMNVVCAGLLDARMGVMVYGCNILLTRWRPSPPSQMERQVLQFVHWVNTPVGELFEKPADLVRPGKITALGPDDFAKELADF